MNPKDLRPGKIIAVHMNYRSRAAERGRSPENPSYFLKSPTTLSISGIPVVRPEGCELLAFEGEIALVLRDVPRNVPRDQAWAYVDYVTAANDLGLYDLRYADPGSNVHSKGFDGYTPVGPDLLIGASIDPRLLRVRTWVDGRLVQDADDSDLLFDASFVIADLSRVTSLIAGDIILLGTPTGSSVIEPGSVVEVEVSAGAASTGRLRSPITQGSGPLPVVGAAPRADDSAREAAFGNSQL
ncbi:fumarylacetoacetate hydrolase family protein [Microbacterium sp. A8/3-1]|uniref:Fumarylacetoacetate hydrolase family protein n=1 Tax=Microbacterium sp. A8/3-1 TaxID=3160749 RepID=A0AAU7VVY0_9MICO